MVARSRRQPSPDLGVLVRGVVVDDEVDVQVLRDIGIDMAQEREELLVAMALLALGEDGSGGDVQGREQGRGSMSHVVVGHPFD